MTLILASQSAARRRLLQAVGLAFSCDAPRLDESEVKQALKAQGATASQAAEVLAEMKAVTVSLRHPGALVIGADQLLSCAGLWFDKPGNRAAARHQLLALSGRCHQLHTSVVVARDGQRLWHHQDQPEVTLRALRLEEIESYLDQAGESVLQSVGAYELEGRGPRLMQLIAGDSFSIQGLPLLPLLAFLAGHGL